MPPTPLPADRPLRVGLAGYGVAGRQFHAPAVLAAGAEVAVVATSDASRVAAVEAELPGVTVVPDLAALLEHGGVDVVVLATPTGLHLGQGLAVVAAGMALVVDKPLAATATQARELVGAAGAAGVPLTVFQNRRYDPELAALREVVDGGLVGDVYRAEYRWDRWRPVPKQRWRETQTAAQGAGLLLDLGSHLLDQAVLLHGRVVSVYAELFERTTVAEDDVFVACRHESGVTSHVSAMSVNGAPGPRARLMGSTGAFVVGTQFDETGAFGDLDGPAGHVGWLVRGTDRSPGPATTGSHQARFYRELAAALQTDDAVGHVPVDPWDAVHVLEVVDAARASARDGTVVALPVDDGRGAPANPVSMGE